MAILADGRVHSTEVVASGAVTLDYEVEKAQIGLPYTWQFETLKLPFGTQAGSGVGKVKSLPHVGLVLHDCGEFSVGTVTYDREEGRKVWPMQDISFLRDGLALDEATPLFVGEVHVAVDGAARRDVRLYMEGDDPLPFTCLALIPQMMANEK